MARNRNPQPVIELEQSDGDSGTDIHITGGDGVDIDVTIDPAAVSDGSAAGNSGGGNHRAGKRGPYKPRKPRSDSDSSRPSRSNSKKNLSAKGVEGILLSIHSILATYVLQNDVWELDKEEAAMLARATIEVADQYSVEVSGKVTAWINLAGTAGVVYGPRIAAAKLQKAIPGAKVA